MSILQVEALSKSFGGVQAVGDLNFTVEPGSIQSVIGPNGAGKTTLFNLITGIYHPDAGRISFAGRDITGLPPHRRAALGIARTFQNLQIFPAMTALETVMVGSHLRIRRGLLPSLLRLPGVRRSDAACRARAEELLVDVGLGDYRQAEAAEMPYGALKRLEIARALAGEPRLLLLDEPAAGLNATETAAIDALIQRIAQRGTTVLLVEHDMRLVMNISQQILVLDYGRKLAEGSAEQVRGNPEVIAAYLGAPAAAAAGRPAGGR